MGSTMSRAGPNTIDYCDHTANDNAINYYCCYYYLCYLYLAELMGSTVSHAAINTINYYCYSYCYHLSLADVMGFAGYQKLL